MPRKKNTPPPRTIPLRVKLLGGFISLILFFIVAEFALRLADTNLYYKNQFFPVNRDIDFTEVYKKDQHLFWRFRENNDINSRRFSYINYHINSTGQRGPEIASEKPDLRVLALGNSCTFGWGVPYEQSWVYLLQEMLRLNLDDTSVEVINAGVPGYSSYQGKIYYSRELYKLNPDIVLIMFGWNDQWSAGKGIPDAEQKMPARWVLALHNAVSPLKLYQFMRKVVLSVTEKEKIVPIDDIKSKRRVSRDQFYMNLQEIVKQVRSQGAIPVLLIPPVASLENYFKGNVSPMHELHKSYQKEIIRLATLKKIPLINLQVVFDEYNDLYDDAHGDPIHFNSKGQAIAAETIARGLLNLLASDTTKNKRK